MRDLDSYLTRCYDLLLRRHEPASKPSADDTEYCVCRGLTDDKTH